LSVVEIGTSQNHETQMSLLCHKLNTKAFYIIMYLNLKFGH